MTNGALNSQKNTFTNVELLFCKAKITTSKVAVKPITILNKE
jgi:hypothetical protein